MDAKRWHQFRSFLDRARSKPTFEAEEREYRLQIAEELREALQTSPDAGLIDVVPGVFRRSPPYLREWIEFHWLVGVERFFLYDNESVDEHHEVLAPYIEDGTVVLHDWAVIPAVEERLGARSGSA